MKASKELISDLARKALNGDQQSFRFLMQVLEELRHPVLREIDQRFSGLDLLQSVLLPLTTLVEGFPKPVVHYQSLVWNSANGRLHNGNLPAEIGFQDQYIGYYKGGERHRDGGGPAVIDVSNKIIGYYVHGEPRTHSRGPFKVELEHGQPMLTYIMEDRMTTLKGYTPIDHDNDIQFDPETDGFEEPVEGGAHVVITRDFVDVEGLGKSSPSNEDIRNLGIWRKELFSWVEWGAGYIQDYLNKFK